MSIVFQDLPSYTQGWTDGLHWLEELYEIAHMIPAQTNNRLADAHLRLMFLNVPSKLAFLSILG